MNFGNRSEKNRQSKVKIRVQGQVEEKEERSDRNQPKVLVGSVRLPQVFGNSITMISKDSNRMSYNLKQAMTDYGIDKGLERKEAVDNIFRSVIKRPKMYIRMETTHNISIRPSNDEDHMTSQAEITQDNNNATKQNRSSKSCPRTVDAERNSQR